MKSVSLNGNSKCEVIV